MISRELAGGLRPGSRLCQTGKLGFSRNLATWEILEQIRIIRAEADRPITGVVFMGMGEPLLNLVGVLDAAEILSHPAGYAISGRSLTLSTAGSCPPFTSSSRVSFRIDWPSP